MNSQFQLQVYAKRKKDLFDLCKLAAEKHLKISLSRYGGEPGWWDDIPGYSVYKLKIKGAEKIVGKV